MEDFIAIATLNDFIFCPYSIYLHSVYADTDDGLYKATPQVRGTIAHMGVDSKKGSSRRGDIMSLSVYSESLHVYGKIDVYRAEKKQLIERKYSLKTIFRGQLYQLWAQYFCMTEMGFPVEELCFYEISANKMIPVNLPTENDRVELERFLTLFRNYSPLNDTKMTNPNKCAHCIYCNLCDKTDSDNVYS